MIQCNFIFIGSQLSLRGVADPYPEALAKRCTFQTNLEKSVRPVGVIVFCSFLSRLAKTLFDLLQLSGHMFFNQL
jgi:hypothetical protein